MKERIILLAALSVMVLGSCAKNEVVEGSFNSNDAIGFSTLSYKQTKAEAITSTNITTHGNSFGVYAYSTGASDWATYSAVQGFDGDPNFMNNEQVSYDDGTSTGTSGVAGWYYSPIKYWPNTLGHMVSFFAYMPYDATLTYVDGTNTAAPSIDYNLFELDGTTGAATTTLSMDDLVVATVLDQVKTYDKVTLSFAHALTRVNFSAKLGADVNTETSIVVTGLRVLGTADSKGVAATGDANASGQNLDSKVFSSASYNLIATTASPAGWDNTLSTSGGSAVQIADPLDAGTTGMNIFAGVENTISITPASNATTTSLSVTGVSIPYPTTDVKYAGLLKDDNYYFLIPPSANGVESENDVRIQVDYDIITADSKLDKGYTQTHTSATLSLPNGSLQLGKAYNVIITIGLTEVKLDAEVSDWAVDTTNPEVSVVVSDVTVSSVADIEDAIASAYASAVSDFTVTYTVPATANNTEISSFDFSGITAPDSNLGMNVNIILDGYDLTAPTVTKKAVNATGTYTVTAVATTSTPAA